MLGLLTTFLPLLIQLIAAIPTIKAAWDAAPKNSFQAVATAVQESLPPALVKQLAEAGSQLFPNLSPEFHAAAAALVVAHPNNTAWSQSALNLLQSTGYVTFGAPIKDINGKVVGHVDLVVDGIYGPHTKAAIVAAQAKMGLPVTGILADAEFTMLASLLSHA